MFPTNVNDQNVCSGYFWLWGFLVCLSGLPWQIASAQESPKANHEPVRPNVIVFLVDDMGLMDSSLAFLTDALGNRQRHPLNDFYRTPQMERLATQGICFNQFYAMSVCSPTRASLMTGQNAARHRITNWINPSENNRGKLGPRDWNWQGLNESTTTIPRLLQRHGYRTIHIGKAHFGPWNSVGADPTRLGFDINRAGSPIGHPGSYFAAKGYGAGTSHAVPHLDSFHATGQFLTAALTQVACEQISQAVGDQRPFFLNLAHYAVHSPFESDPHFAFQYTDSGKPKPAQAFATLVAGIDQSLGQILDHVNQLGIAENTFIFFLGDNGTDAPLGNPHEIACAAPLRGKKGAHYEGGMRVPMIAAWAHNNEQHPLQQRVRVAHDRVQTQVASVCDLFPTICEITEIPRPPDHTIDGQSLLKLFTGERDPLRPQEFWMHFPHDNHRSNYFTVFRQNHWKLIYHYYPAEQSNGQRYQLFDLNTDPSESHCLATQYPEVVRELVTAMRQRLDDCQAVYPEDADGNPMFPIVPK